MYCGTRGKRTSTLTPPVRGQVKKDVLGVCENDEECPEPAHAVDNCTRATFREFGS